MTDATREPGLAAHALGGGGLMRLLRQAVLSPQARALVFERVRERGLGEVMRSGGVSQPHVISASEPAPRSDWANEATAIEAEIAEKKRHAPSQLYARLAQARRMQGDISGAVAAVEAGIAHRGEASILLRESAEIAMERKRWRDAVALWSRVAKLDGDKMSASRFVRWSTSLQMTEAFEEAERVLKRGLALHPTDQRLNNELVDLAWSRKVADTKRRAAAVTRAPTIESVCETFWHLESELSLDKWRAHGIAPWPLLRMPLYYMVTQNVGLYDPPHPALKSRTEEQPGRSEEFASEWAKVETAYASGDLPPRDAKRAHAVLMGTRKVDGSEPYTDALRAELGERAYLLDVSADYGPNSFAFHSYRDLFRARYRRRRELGSLPQESTEICRAIWMRLVETLGVDAGNLAKTCRNRIVDFDAVSRGFEIFFTMRPIEALYLTNAYGAANRAVVHGARATGARIVELQHGFISPYHLGYSWPGRPDVPYSPDELWCFGRFWPETTPLPKHTRHRVIGAPYVKKLAQEAAGLPRDENLVIFTSQGVIGRKLFDVAVDVARRRPDKHFIYRLHPNEALEDYQALMDAVQERPLNLALSHGTPNIFALLASSAIQVGAFSTTLFEGMSLGTRTIVIEMAGSEYMRPAVARGDVLMVRTPEELAAKLDLAPLCADPQTYYAEPLARLL